MEKISKGGGARMKATMNKTLSLPAFVAANFRLQAADFALFAGTAAVIWAGAMLVVTVIYQVTGDPEALGFGVPGIALMALAVLLSLVSAASRFWLEFTLGVQMSTSRRRMLAAETALCLATGAMLLALARLGNAAWRVLLAPRVPTDAVEDVLARIPLWGWLVAWLAPIALGMLGSGLVLHFGPRMFWAIYFVCIALCFAPSWVGSRIERSALAASVWAAFYPWLPPVALGLTALCAVAGSLLLRRAAIPQ
jgi:hypothetical protein